MVIVPPPACFFNLVRSHALSPRQPWLLKAASSFYFRIGFDVNTSVLYFLRQVSLNIWRKRRFEQYFDLLIVLNNCIWFMFKQKLCNLLLVLLVSKKCYVGNHLLFVFVVQECFNWRSSWICICCARICCNWWSSCICICCARIGCIGGCARPLAIASPVMNFAPRPAPQLGESLSKARVAKLWKTKTGKLGDEIPPALPPLLAYIAQIYKKHTSYHQSYFCTKPNLTFGESIYIHLLE